MRGRVRALLGARRLLGSRRRDAAAHRTHRHSAAHGCCWSASAASHSTTAAPGGERLGHAVTALARTRVVSAALALERPAARELDDYYFGRAVAEITGSRPVPHQRSEDGAQAAPAGARARAVRTGRHGGALAAVRRGLAAGAALAESTRLLRNLGNLPANVCTPRYLAAQARELERTYRRRLRVRDLRCGRHPPPEDGLLPGRNTRQRGAAALHRARVSRCAPQSRTGGAGRQGRDLRYRRHLAQGSAQHG